MFAIDWNGMRRLLLAGGLLVLSLPVFGQTGNAWVSDRFEVTLRTGPSTNNAIQMMLTSGTQLEVLQRDPDSGYSRVRTAGGTQGWVLTRYLMQEPAARQQLERLTNQVTNANARGSTLTEQLEAVRTEHRQLTERANALERERNRVQQELDEIKRTAENVLAIENQNQRLQEQVTDYEIRINTLEQQNRELSGQKNRNWFIAGASVLFVGILLGIWLPRIRWQRRSRYERF